MGFSICLVVFSVLRVPAIGNHGNIQYDLKKQVKKRKKDTDLPFSLPSLPLYAI